jgi:hypothetical protein
MIILFALMYVLVIVLENLDIAYVGNVKLDYIICRKGTFCINIFLSPLMEGHLVRNTPHKFCLLPCCAYMHSRTMTPYLKPANNE